MDFFLVNASNVVQNVCVFIDAAHAAAWCANQGVTPIARTTQSPMPQTGDTVDPTTGAWVSSPPPPAPVPVTLITQIAFMQLFTATEMVGIYTAAASSPVIQVLLAQLQMATDGMINLTNPTVIAGVNQLETAGLIAAGRAAQILAG